MENKDPTEELLKVLRDKSKSDEKRSQAAYLYGLLMFAERIDDKTVRVTSDTQEKLRTYIAILRCKQEVPK